MRAYLFIDANAGLMCYSAAGHPAMLRLRRPAMEIRELEKNGLALGFLQEADYSELEHPLEAGDRLLLYTDGLTEAGNAAEDLFGIDRGKSALAAGAALPLDEAADRLLHTMNAWSGQPPADDLTIVIVDWNRHAMTA